MICRLVKKSETSPPLLMGKYLEILQTSTFSFVRCRLPGSPPDFLDEGFNMTILQHFQLLQKNVAKILKIWKMLQSQCCKDFGTF